MSFEVVLHSTGSLTFVVSCLCIIIALDFTYLEVKIDKYVIYVMSKDLLKRYFGVVSDLAKMYGKRGSN